ncbi:GNAT family N-acetyltransferase [Sporosarcina sp. Te-1]|uniref:GNAT family N-acetyltransferase n=1 Tax=Sporosarcina sp. Te-1 TaxID=2818390 RepID=UPI001A9F296F|nr:GNAT family N-acetyltransferase [Sporosarcina sp. Te-1]QTD40085.1 GNAT family N-acetyltransferase [Sporosarcina sp. Te-1]
MELFSIIKKDSEYWLVDQMKQDGVTEATYLDAFRSLLEEWKEGEIGYLSLLMDPSYENWLMEQGFRKVSTVVEYTRRLEEDFSQDSAIESESLADSQMTDDEFADLYERCRSDSANKNNLFTIAQVMESLENELGPEWRSHCFSFRRDGELLGLSIPIIEEGTKDEGRLFYFGTVPEARGKGYGTAMHRISLDLLKRLGAATYVGSTDEANENMIRIFKGNGSTLRDRKGIYRLDAK